jgi:hypothetical protein
MNHLAWEYDIENSTSTSRSRGVAKTRRYQVFDPRKLVGGGMAGAGLTNSPPGQRQEREDGREHRDVDARKSYTSAMNANSHKAEIERAAPYL